MGRFEEAEARLRSIDLMALFSAGRHAEAESIATQMIETWPDYGLAWKVLGAVLAIQQRFETAVPTLRRALAAEATDPSGPTANLRPT